MISNHVKRFSRAHIARTFAIAAAILVPATFAGGVAAQASPSNASVLALGLNNPRGLALGPHGLGGTSNAIVRVNAEGSITQIANLSQFLMTHPVANPEPAVQPGDFEPDGTWYSMINKGDALYALEPNHQELERIERNGQVSRVVDFSKLFVAPEDWRGPTVITRFEARSPSEC